VPELQLIAAVVQALPQPWPAVQPVHPPSGEQT
jgi:hypothetical protein